MAGTRAAALPGQSLRPDESRKIQEMPGIVARLLRLAQRDDRCRFANELGAAALDISQLNHWAKRHCEDFSTISAGLLTLAGKSYPNAHSAALGVLDDLAVYVGIAAFGSGQDAFSNAISEAPRSLFDQLQRDPAGWPRLLKLLSVLKAEREMLSKLGPLVELEWAAWSKQIAAGDWPIGSFETGETGAADDPPPSGLVYSIAIESPQEWAKQFGWGASAKGSREFNARVSDGTLHVLKITTKRYRVAIQDLPASHPESARNSNAK